MAKNQITLQATVETGMAGQRLDQAAASLFPEYSRARLQQWIKAGALTLDGRSCQPKERVLGGETVAVVAEQEPQGEWRSQAIPLEVVHEDEAIAVIDKPAGLVVHPGAGNPEATLLNALLHRYPGQELIPRAGIVHRLDKDTSGLMVVARTLEAHTSLVAQLQQRTVSRDYEAVVQGVPTGGGTIDAAIGRHPRVRTRMAVVQRGGKPAVSHYRIIRKYDHHSHIRVSLETGRTHQIRVHMAHISFPLLGDPVYGGRLKLPPGISEQLRTVLREFRRQALHAAALSLDHPVTGERLTWNSLPPADFRTLLAALAEG